MSLEFPLCKCGNRLRNFSNFLGVTINWKSNFRLYDVELEFLTTIAVVFASHYLGYDLRASSCPRSYPYCSLTRFEILPSEFHAFIAY